MLSVKTSLLATKTYLTYVFVTRQPFGIPYWNVDTCIFVARAISIFSSHCCTCNSLGCIATIRCGNACHGSHSGSVYSGTQHRQFNSPRLVKGEASFPNPQWALIGSNHLWRVNDSPHYQEFVIETHHLSTLRTVTCHMYIWNQTESYAYVLT